MDVKTSVSALMETLIRASR